MHTSLLCLILSGTILMLFIVLYTDQIPWYMGHSVVDNTKKLGYYNPVHAVVIDAGSTGSRVSAFTFHEAYSGRDLVLDKELFEETEPGLSFFANEPEKGAATIAHLLEKAKNEIPGECWFKTPLILRATAGLRMLPAEQAEKLLASVRALFKDAPFLTNNASVEIMDGTDEGIFSWFTINFLLELINANPTNTVAALDLGGGSTQVTFSATMPTTLRQTKFIHQAVTPRGPISVYANSFSGLGLMAARHAVITLDQPNTTVVISECVNPIIKNETFHYHGTDYLVSGLRENYPTDIQMGKVVPVVSFYNCYQIITSYIKRKAKAPEELPLKTIFAFSYYFSMATEVGLIDEATGGQIRVKDFRRAAEKLCHEANAEHPFMCLDLTFIWVLLEKGFGLNDDIRIHVSFSGTECGNNTLIAASSVLLSSNREQAYV